MSALCQKRTLLAAPPRTSDFAIITLLSAAKTYLGFVLVGLLPISPLSANAMNHPARSDFHTVVTAAGVSVTFKPTNSTFSFYRFAGSGALSLAGVQHAGRDTGDYPPDEVQDMAQQIASGQASVHFGPFQDEEGINRIHWENFARQAKRYSAHKAASDLRMLAQVEKWMAIIREISRKQPDHRRHRVDYAI